MDKESNVAIVLSAGTGSRMKSTIAKQYMLLEGKPILYYSLMAFQNTDFIDAIIIVTGANDVDTVKKEIVEYYGINKVKAIVPGGKNRYDSVICGIEGMNTYGLEAEHQYVYIHDGARPFITEKELEKLHQEVIACKACVAAVPTKDTIKIADEDGYVNHTPDRRYVWSIQTPQVFEYNLLKAAYMQLKEELKSEGDLPITDDASVIERYGNHKVKLVNTSYKNIKITTPEDMNIAQTLLKG